MAFFGNKGSRMLDNWKLRWARTSSSRYCAYLRQKGVVCGQRTVFRNPRSISIDLTRPSLVTIGNDVDFNHNFVLLTHDWGSRVFRTLYGELVPSSGAVKIGDNVVFGRNVTVLKGVEIGSNCIIGAGSIVSRNIPDNSVAVGIPAEVICSLEEYYAKRQKRCIEEALEYARSIQERFHRRPVEADFREEFPLFVNGDEADLHPELPIRQQLGTGFEMWRKNHRAQFDGFENFLKEAGL
jgi:acetyltransferase-like isoleucine patch superfamily enzyme